MTPATVTNRNLGCDRWWLLLLSPETRLAVLERDGQDDEEEGE